MALDTLRARGRRAIGDLSLLNVSLAACAVACSGSCDSGRARVPTVSAVDVHRFVDAYHRLVRSDSACAPFAAYIAGASEGLRAYVGKYDMTQRDLCRAVRRSPRGYLALEAKLPALDSAITDIRTLFTKLETLIPGGRPPDVYFVVGDGISGGTVTNGRSPIVLIGMERNGAVAGLPGTIAHEYVHTQQDYPLIGIMTGGPSFLRGTLLRHAIKEGGADFIASLVVGKPRHNAFGEAHAAELWRDFQRDKHTKDYRLWLYNGWNAKELKSLGERPGDLGYWMGYLITKAYYDKAPDKAAAIHDLLTITDFDTFLARSGYAGPAPR